jgi:hypothetical protein
MSPMKVVEGEPSLSVPGAVQTNRAAAGGKGRPDNASGGASPRPPGSPGAKARAETPELTPPTIDIDANHPLHVLYNTPWVEDGETTKEMAVQVEGCHGKLLEGTSTILNCHAQHSNCAG